MRRVLDECLVIPEEGGLLMKVGELIDALTSVSDEAEVVVLVGETMQLEVVKADSGPDHVTLTAGITHGKD